MSRLLDDDERLSDVDPLVPPLRDVAHHCCSPDCECRLTSFWLDGAGLAEAAKERGVARPVEVRVRPRKIKRWWQWWRQPDPLEGAGAEAAHWATVPLSSVDHHIITLLHGYDVQDTLKFWLHEIEHCIQCESFPTIKAWNRAYDAHTADYEQAAVAAEAEWQEYGHLIERNEP